MDAFIIPAAQLGSTVFVVVAFLWYLLKTSDKQIAAQVTLAKALQRLTDMVERNSTMIQVQIPLTVNWTMFGSTNTDFMLWI